MKKLNRSFFHWSYVCKRWYTLYCDQWRYTTNDWFENTCKNMNSQNNREIHTVPGFISLHIRSTWETICDPQAVCCAQNLCPSLTESSSLLNGMSDQRVPPPSPEVENFRFELTNVQTREPLPTPPKMKNCLGARMWRLILYPRRIPSSS